VNWYRVDVGAHEHKKVRRVAEELGIKLAEAWWIVTRVWDRAGFYDSRSGIVDLTPDELLRAMALHDAGVTGVTAESLVDALLQHRVLDRDCDGNLVVHGWAGRNGAATPAERARAFRERKRKRNDVTLRATFACNDKRNEQRNKESNVYVRTYERTNIQTNGSAVVVPPVVEISETNTQSTASDQTRSRRTPPRSRSPEAVEVATQTPPPLLGLTLYEQDVKLVRRWEELFAAWKIAYPGVDVVAEIREAHAWEVANPTRRKKDRPRFLAAWLARAQDRAPVSNAATRAREHEARLRRETEAQLRSEGRSEAEIIRYFGGAVPVPDDGSPAF
jgi:hypothetical protein